MYGSGDVTIDPADIKKMREYYKTLCHRLNKLDKMRKLFGNYKNSLKTKLITRIPLMLIIKNLFAKKL